MTTPEQTTRGVTAGLERHDEFGRPETPATPAEQAAVKAEPAINSEEALKEGVDKLKKLPKSIDKLPDDFDYKPASIAGIAMMDNPDHPDLLGEARKLLVMSGVPESRLAIMDSHFLINAARGKSLLAQRGALNAFWHVQFSAAGSEAYGARQLLVTSGDHEEWLKWFGRAPLEAILKFELPKPEGLVE